MAKVGGIIDYPTDILSEINNLSFTIVKANNKEKISHNSIDEYEMESIGLNTDQ